jgi:hemolysin activation/secretion protein
VTESKAFTGFVGVDNLSPPSVGSERFGTVLSYRNLTGIGDEVSGSYYHTAQGGSNAFDWSYRAPVNPMNGTVQVRIAPSRGEIVTPQFAPFGIRSQTDLYEISYRQPLIRTPREELALSFGFAIQDGQTFLFQDTPFPFGIGPDAEGNSRTRILKFGQDYVRRDLKGAWALRSQFSFGLDLFNATVNPSPIPDGRFFSWLGQVQRVQRLGTSQLLIAQADLQLAPNSLLPSQQFVIGGGQSVRGYRQNVRSGDNGVRFLLENRITVQRDGAGQSVLQVAPFVNLGAVWNRSSNPNRLPEQNFLAGGGIGLILEPTPQLSLRLDYALPFVKLDDRGENAQDRGFYFSLGYSF